MEVFWCTTCLNMSTRPRIEFNSDGQCNACVWKDEKKSVNWDARQDELVKLLAWSKSKSHSFDCIVPVSGGKDGSYVSHKLKSDFGMTPLCVTVRPPLALDIGEKNLNNFIDSGFHHIQISPSAHVMQLLNKFAFEDGGYPYLGWMIAIKTAVIKLALQLKISLIVYGEDGEIEYGGSTETKFRPTYDIEYMKRVYFQGAYEPLIERVRSLETVSDVDLEFWRFPSNEEIAQNELMFTHFSYFEPWDSYRNYVVAKEHCGLAEKEDSNVGTFTNFAQNDQALATLHYYLMYLKFGFGRATQDAGIEIRRGSMTREQAINLVRAYDNQYPEDHIPIYLEYYKLTRDEFDEVLARHVNKSLFELSNGRWLPKFEVGQSFSI
jgi:N-acetyl sugar amidotransferase